MSGWPPPSWVLPKASVTDERLSKIWEVTAVAYWPAISSTVLSSPSASQFTMVSWLMMYELRVASGGVSTAPEVPMLFRPRYVLRTLTRGISASIEFRAAARACIVSLSHSPNAESYSGSSKKATRKVGTFGPRASVTSSSATSEDYESGVSMAQGELLPSSWPYVQVDVQRDAEKARGLVCSLFKCDPGSPVGTTECP